MLPDKANWLRSSFCADGACVEVQSVDGCVCVRDAKDPCSSMLRFSREAWRHFLDGVASGDFKLLGR